MSSIEQQKDGCSLHSLMGEVIKMLQNAFCGAFPENANILEGLGVQMGDVLIAHIAMTLEGESAGNGSPAHFLNATQKLMYFCLDRNILGREAANLFVSSKHAVPTDEHWMYNIFSVCSAFSFGGVRLQISVIKEIPTNKNFDSVERLGLPLCDAESCATLKSSEEKAMECTWDPLSDAKAAKDTKYFHNPDLMRGCLPSVGPSCDSSQNARKACGSSTLSLKGGFFQTKQCSVSVAGGQGGSAGKRKQGEGVAGSRMESEERGRQTSGEKQGTQSGMTSTLHCGSSGSAAQPRQKSHFKEPLTSFVPSQPSFPSANSHSKEASEPAASHVTDSDAILFASDRLGKSDFTASLPLHSHSFSAEQQRSTQDVQAEMGEKQRGGAAKGMMPGSTLMAKDVAAKKIVQGDGCRMQFEEEVMQNWLHPHSECCGMAEAEWLIDGRGKAEEEEEEEEEGKRRRERELEARVMEQDRVIALQESLIFEAEEQIRWMKEQGKWRRQLAESQVQAIRWRDLAASAYDESIAARQGQAEAFGAVGSLRRMGKRSVANGVSLGEAAQSGAADACFDAHAEALSFPALSSAK
ncbi:uncharacterized protein MONOS_3539 [Monocercomonoides exilis]|uniref:uncharacterized protein n=1 Tax=Monocercomonoides exilis TaxID=2049356 RepID=UPI0035598959|nr:hypothetical protein MONOS_3539 [Monocercomonoides exilis]|eukprot:MONOS_3539.1-p1 / transcript=MONOS_3539.1 / gene=MONOS_3539 / organism=Monocercomonoides_exilis_PA203 / gene_product=unspecified product / transcript_product=unspecified product / location=Mono_scaffold00084:24092-26071(+) / protein_length=581 / sequence_SO=supercontig / SO=protein_coding / is_pseudo=false